MAGLALLEKNQKILNLELLIFGMCCCYRKLLGEVTGIETTHCLLVSNDSFVV